MKYNKGNNIIKGEKLLLNYSYKMDTELFILTKEEYDLWIYMTLTYTEN